MYRYYIGQELYGVTIEDDGTCMLNLSIVRAIRKDCVYATMKVDGITWVKCSIKHGDYGWDNSVHSSYRDTTTQGKPFYMLRSTKLQAWKRALNNIEWSTEEVGKARATINRMIKKIQNK